MCFPPPPSFSSPHSLKKWNLSRFVGDSNLAEEQTHGAATWTQETLHENSEELLHNSTIDLQEGQEWSNTPDMGKGHLSKHTAPVQSSRDGTDEGENHIEQILATLKASVGAFPDAICAVGSFWLCEAIFECDLEKKTTNETHKKILSLKTLF